MNVIAISLQSGNNGNCIYVETNGLKLLFDAGISCIQAATRLAAYGRNIRDVNALIISHDHDDHIRHAGVYQRKYGIPIYITPKTLHSVEKKRRLGKLDTIYYFMAGGILDFGSVSIKTIPSPHDGADGALFIVRSKGKRLGIWTDLGYVFQELYSLITSLDALFIESNYDPRMLAHGPYSEHLKKRIRGPEGHLSNIEAAQLLKAGKRLKWACLSHLSENNNNPRRALQTHREVLGNDLDLCVASRYTATGILCI